MNSHIDYALGGPAVANPDGTFPTQFANVNVVPGPGVTIAGNHPHALDFASSGRGEVDLAGLAPDSKRFTVRTVFQAAAGVNDRQNLLESTLLPFSLYIRGRDGSSRFDVVAATEPQDHGWRSTSNEYVEGLQTGKWYTVDLVYDVDTLGLFVDGKIVAVHAFPSGRIATGAGGKLVVGTWVDGARNQFNGKMAAIEWSSGIPEELESQLDERRTSPEWYITYKHEALRKRGLNLGAATGKIAYKSTTDAYLQHFQRGALMYQSGNGAAFEMHGAIYAKFKAMRSRDSLGYLVSDEVMTTKRGGRKNVFSRGALYWSNTTGAVPVLDAIYLEYEALGESRALGFPTAAARSIPNGLEQIFQGGRMYAKSGDTGAHEVHGGILARLLATGGVRKWGFPLTNESDVKKGSRVVGKFSNFEGCTIYWSSSTGAFEVHGDIRRKYLSHGGPTGWLGFPTSNEADIPGVSGPGRFNTFQHGTLLWYGTYSGMIDARSFRLFIGRINTDESEGAFMGQNDLYIKVTVKDGAAVVYDKRHPRGDWSGRNIVDVNLNIPVTITPRGQQVVLTVDVWESDSGAPFGGGDDHIGKWTKSLDMANGWGLRENGGILDSGSFSKINSIKASVKPQVDVASLSLEERFWGVKNKRTPELSYAQYASAFSDVDSDTEWWDVTDWLEKAFYELVVDSIAGGGNCFGMSLEAIYANKGSSPFSLPLNRFTDWNVVRPEVNVKHAYQVGAQPIWWFLGEFITGNTHDPKDVFSETRREFSRGNNPVLCISQNYDFSGAPHCILPVAWDSSSKPWKITISDPNFPNQLKQLTVNPDNNTFRYVGSSTYTGGEWSGGRLHYMPFSLLCRPPRTPIWDAILLILAGTILILGEDAQTVAITDSLGNDIDAFGARAKEQLRGGHTLNDFFVGFKGYDRIRREELINLGTIELIAAAQLQPKPKGTIPGEVLVSMRQRSGEVSVGPAAVSPSVAAHLPIELLTASRAMREVGNLGGGDSRLARSLRGRTLHDIAADGTTMATLSPSDREAITRIVATGRPGDFNHRVAGLRRGKLQYAAKHGLGEFRLESAVAKGEVSDIEVTDPGTSKHTIRVGTDRDKAVGLAINQKLGVNGDHIALAVENVPVKSAVDLEVNMKPGLTGVDLVTAGGSVDANVTVTGLVDGRRLDRRFRVPIDGGARLKLSTLLSDNEMSVSRIDRLFGSSHDTEAIRPIT